MFFSKMSKCLYLEDIKNPCQISQLNKDKIPKFNKNEKLLTQKSNLKQANVLKCF